MTFDAPGQFQCGGYLVGGQHDDGQVRLAHLGDLGHALDAATVKAVGKVDVVLVPVGGFFTIDYKEAAQVVESLAPRIVVPMHYKTAATDFPITTEDDFLAVADANELNGNLVPAATFYQSGLAQFPPAPGFSKPAGGSR